MRLIEWLADRLAPNLVAPASLAASLLALAGCGCLFAAVVFGSFLWAGFGAAALTAAAALWYAAAVAEATMPRASRRS